MIIDIISTHVKLLSTDLENIKFDNIPDTQRPLYDAGILALKEISFALDNYFVDRLENKLHQDIIIAGMNFVTRWERFLSNLHSGSFSFGATKTFHEYLLRFIKGALKYYRIWRLDLQK